MIQIRRAALADADRLALVGSATFLETFAGTLAGDGVVAHCTSAHAPAAYAGYLAGGAAAWLAELDAAPVGYALLAAPDLPVPVGEGDIELKRIYLLARFHGGGAGGALMDAAVAEAVARGGRRLLLGVFAGNDRAIGFYAHHGFAQVGTRRFTVGGHDYDDAILARSL